MSSPATVNANSKAHRRSKTGCQTCRDKRKKCDETRPCCQRCARTGSTCHWPSNFHFRYENTSRLSDDRRVRKRRSDGTAVLGEDARPGAEVTETQELQDINISPLSPTGFRISDVVGAGNVEIDTSLLPSRTYDQVVDSPPIVAPTHTVTGPVNGSHAAYYSGMMQTSPPDDRSLPLQAGLSSLLDHGSSAVSGGAGEDWSHDRATRERNSSLGLLPSPCLNMSRTTPVSNNDTSVRPSTAHETTTGFSPDVLTDDGIFLPGSTYQELHQALRSGIFHTAQSQPSSPRPNLHPPILDVADIEANPCIGSDEEHAEVSTSGSSTPPELTPGQEVVLWNNWTDEIGPWLDKFDHSRHHQHTLPAMAQATSHLRYSMLALSARQLERKSGSIPSSTSLGLYQWAIHLLLPVLHTKSVAILASCVILCVFEMSSCSPKAWRRHLDGCADLIMAMDVRGDQGGLQQSLFWCFARMDVCGALISSERTLIPVDRWYSDTRCSAGASGIMLSTGFEDHASLACHLLAKVLSLLDPKRRASLARQRRVRDDTFVADWLCIHDELIAWCKTRSPEMQPVFTITNNHGNTSATNPFHTILYSSGAAISGNQLYHTAMLLMLRSKPKGIVAESRSALWHARQICAISMSNSHHGAWINSIQPVWLAGQYMSHPSEHRAIVDLYMRIERDTGWGATWRATDLQEYWGDLS